MRYKSIKNNTKLIVNSSYQGERIEEKIERIVTQNEPITDDAPMIYTERNEGLLPAYDIRTDRWEIAINAMDKVSKSNQAKRDAKIDADKTAISSKQADESIQATPVNN